MEIYKNLSIESLPNEEWRDIVGYEGLYQISNMGIVKRLLSIKCKKERLVAVTRDLKKGYCRIMLSKEGKSRRFLIHRLLAEHFIPNINNKPCIDHINGDRSDNRLENLRWCTHKENNNFPLAKLRNSESQKASCTEERRRKMSKRMIEYMKNPEHRRLISEKRKLNWLNPEYVEMQKQRHKKKVVCQYDLEMNFIQEFISINEASRTTGVNNSSIIRCCKGNVKTAGNFLWRYKDE